MPDSWRPVDSTKRQQVAEIIKITLVRQRKGPLHKLQYSKKFSSQDLNLRKHLLSISEIVDILGPAYTVSTEWAELANSW